VTSPLKPTTSNFFSSPNTCGYSPYVKSSLTRGWVCRSQFLLALASAVILRSESCGTHDQILLSQIRDFTFRRLRRLAGLRWRYSNSPPHGMTRAFLTPHFEYLIRHVPHKKHRVRHFLYCCMFIHCPGNVFAELLPSNGCLFWLHCC
jgi:hypothetical protein